MLGTLLGGIGVFLLGMALLTDGLQAAAGERLRLVIQRTTRTPWSGAVAGAVTTAVVQSSSATTLATLGFVGAGLLTLQGAIGVVFGANLGTTATSWVVSAVGLKVSMSTFALPLVGVGALGRLLLRGRRAAVSSSLAGFGLIFVGIGLLQDGMKAVQADFDPGRFAGEGFLGLLILVGVGILMTVVMQSSSAAVTTTLAAVDSGAISILQAAALVIGQNVGTTVTAAIGSIGAGAVVKRAAAAHILFNVGTGIVALALTPVLWEAVQGTSIVNDAALAIAAFHTVFNVLGIAIFLPLTGRIAAWVTRFIPERGESLTRALQLGRSAMPAAVVEAAATVTRDIATHALGCATSILAHKPSKSDLERLDAIKRALDRTLEAVGSVELGPAAVELVPSKLDTLHAIDHLSRLEEALRERHHGALAKEPALGAQAAALGAALAEAADAANPVEITERASQAAAVARKSERPSLLDAAARGTRSPEEAEAVLEAMRWVDRIGYHSWRAQVHLPSAAVQTDDSGPPSSSPPRSSSNPVHRGDESYAAQA